MHFTALLKSKIDVSVDCWPVYFPHLPIMKRNKSPNRDFSIQIPSRYYSLLSLEQRPHRFWHQSRAGFLDLNPQPSSHNCQIYNHSTATTVAQYFFPGALDDLAFITVFKA